MTALTIDCVESVLRNAGHLPGTGIRSIGLQCPGYELTPPDGPVESVAWRPGGSWFAPGPIVASYRSFILARYRDALIAAGLPARVEGDRVVFDAGEHRQP